MRRGGTVAPLVARHCVSCHRTGGGSFPLTTYAEARPWAKAIRDEVSERRMPPWPPQRGVGAFANDPSLSPRAVELVVAWAEGGAPDGPSVPAPSPAPSPSPALGPLARHALSAGEAVLRVEGELALAQPARVLAVVPHARAGEPVQVQLVRAGGECEPLVYVQRFEPKLAYTYWLSEPLPADAGARLEVLPRGARAEVLIAKGAAPPDARRSPRTAR